MEYWKLLPLLAVLIFFLPVRFKAWWAFVVVVIGAIGFMASALTVLLDLGLPDSLNLYIPRLSHLSALFAAVISLTSLSASLYAVGFIRVNAHRKTPFEISLHLGALVVLFYSMVMVVTAATRFEFLFFWELMTLASFVLVIFEAQLKEALHAAVGYLILMHVGFFCLLIGSSHVPMDSLWGYGSMPLASWSVLLVGFALKAGLFPLHIWLPVVHTYDPPHVAALMSGTMAKMGVFGIISITFNVSDALTAGYVLFIAGGVTAIFGIVKASAQTNLKRLLAYSSIENIGIITLGIGLGTIGKTCANMPLAMAGYAGAMIHLLGHSVYKNTLFMSAGAVIRQVGSSSINAMGGLLKRMPLTGTVFFLGVLAICAIPPLCGFFSEFVLLSGMFESLINGSATLEALIGIVTLAVVAGMAVLTFSKAFGTAMLGTPRSLAASKASEASWTAIIAMSITTLAIFVGAYAFPYIVFTNSAELFGVTPDYEQVFANMNTVLIISWGVVGFALCLIVLRYFVVRRRIVERETWGCGFEAPTPKIQYTAHSVSADVAKTVGIENNVSPIPAHEVYPVAHSFEVNGQDRMNRVITRYSSHFLHRWTARLALFQTGKTNHYILHALLFFVLVLVLSIFSLL